MATDKTDKSTNLQTASPSAPATDYRVDALNTLKSIMEDHNMPPANRIEAARTILFRPEPTTA